MTSKICPKCRQEFSLTDEFWHKDKSRKSGYQAYCKGCQNSIAKTWRQDNTEKSKEYVRRWYKTNSENRKERIRRWNQANPEKRKEIMRQWRQNHPDRVIASEHKRRALKNGNGGSYTTEELYQQFLDQDGRCFHCGKFISLTNTKTRHIDHWIPLSKGGSNDISNIKLLCPHCNHTKHNKLPWEWNSRYKINDL